MGKHVAACSAGGILSLMSEASTLASSKLAKWIREGISEERLHAQPNPLWKRLSEIGTECWLDTGDMDQAAALWSTEFTALTTNNTLLNHEIQKGIYDEWIPQAAKVIRDEQPGVSEQELILEIAFGLNARHGLRLVERFGAFVSVELHTGLAHDIEKSVSYGKRYHALCPDHFIVKVPLTPSGLLAARRLEDAGIPVNFTLGFSARQNYMISCVARSHWCNVFMGRLNAYCADQGIGDGNWVGERATLASQKAVKGLREQLQVPTRQIGASMRTGEQVSTLAGLDVYTMPVTVAQGFLDSQPQISTLQDRTQEDYQPKWAAGVDASAEGLEQLWQISDSFREACLQMGNMDPENTSAEELVEALNQSGHGDVFPKLSEQQHSAIAEFGKVPDRTFWSTALAAGEVGLDALFTLAGLYSFSKDQADLDDRIRRCLT